MTNFYDEFSIPVDSSLEEIKSILTKERKKWNLRQNAADLSKRQLAEKKLLLLDEASEVFQDSYTKDSYDIKLGKNKGSGQTATQENNVNVEGSIEDIVLRIENVYNVGNNDSVIELCNKALNMGHKDVRIYDYLCAAYEENGHTDLAFATAKTALSITNHNWFKYLIAKYDVYYYNNINEARALIDELKQNNIETESALALSVEIDLREGNVEKADSEIEDYLSKHPNDENYKQKIASAYWRFSDTFLSTADDGYNYWNTRDDYIASLNARKKAYDIYPNNETKELYDRTIGFDKKKFDKEDLVGPIGIGFIGFVLLMSGGIGILFGLLLLALFGWIVYSKFNSDWENERDDHANTRPLPKQIARISTNIAKVIGKIYLAILKFIFALLSSY